MNKFAAPNRTNEQVRGTRGIEFESWSCEHAQKPKKHTHNGPNANSSGSLKVPQDRSTTPCDESGHKCAQKEQAGWGKGVKSNF